jgi:hypothetical protein
MFRRIVVEKGNSSYIQLLFVPANVSSSDINKTDNIRIFPNLCVE